MHRNQTKSWLKKSDFTVADVSVPETLSSLIWKKRRIFLSKPHGHIQLLFNDEFQVDGVDRGCSEEPQLSGSAVCVHCVGIQWVYEGISTASTQQHTPTADYCAVWVKKWLIRERNKERKRKKEREREK